MGTDSNQQRPTVTWGTLKGKKVKSNDGKDLGEIKEISQNFLRIEKGLVNKEKFWIPKYLADAFDGKTLWLMLSEEETLGRYLYGTEPPSQQYTQEFEAFKKTQYGQRTTFLDDLDQNVRLIDKKSDSAPASSIDAAADEYKNIRDPNA